MDDESQRGVRRVQVLAIVVSISLFFAILFPAIREARRSARGRDLTDPLGRRPDPRAQQGLSGPGRRDESMRPFPAGRRGSY